MFPSGWYRLPSSTIQRAVIQIFVDLTLVADNVGLQVIVLARTYVYNEFIVIAWAFRSALTLCFDGRRVRFVFSAICMTDVHHLLGRSTPSAC